MEITQFMPHLNRPARRCGIHGDDTTSGRCRSCDIAAAKADTARQVRAITERSWFDAWQFAAARARVETLCVLIMGQAA